MPLQLSHKVTHGCAVALADGITISDPYAALKELTRGRRIGQAELIEFVQTLEIGDEAKQRLLALTPASYVGAAAKLLAHLRAN